MIKAVFALNHRQLLKHRRVFTVKCLHVDVVTSDSDKRKEENVAIDRVRSFNAARFQLVAFVRKSLDWSHQVVAANR